MQLSRCDPRAMFYALLPPKIMTDSNISKNERRGGVSLKKIMAFKIGETSNDVTWYIMIWPKIPCVTKTTHGTFGATQKTKS
jgi:hypothetical protein